METNPPTRPSRAPFGMSSEALAKEEAPPAKRVRSVVGFA